MKVDWAYGDFITSNNNHLVLVLLTPKNATNFEVQYFQELCALGLEQVFREAVIRVVWEPQGELNLC